MDEEVPLLGASVQGAEREATRPKLVDMEEAVGAVPRLASAGADPGRWTRDKVSFTIKM